VVAKVPIAEHAPATAQETAVKLAVSAFLGLESSCLVQALPSHASASGTSPEAEKYQPTASHELAAEHETPVIVV
jgi:hypothetical protein